MATFLPNLSITGNPNSAPKKAPAEKSNDPRGQVSSGRSSGSSMSQSRIALTLEDRDNICACSRFGLLVQLGESKVGLEAGERDRRTDVGRVVSLGDDGATQRR